MPPLPGFDLWYSWVGAGDSRRSAPDIPCGAHRMLTFGKRSTMTMFEFSACILGERRRQELSAKGKRPFKPESLLQPEDVAAVVLNA